MFHNSLKANQLFNLNLILEFVLALTKDGMINYTNIYYNAIILHGNSLI